MSYEPGSLTSMCRTRACSPTASTGVGDTPPAPEQRGPRPGRHQLATHLRRTGLFRGGSAPVCALGRGSTERTNPPLTPDPSTKAQAQSTAPTRTARLLLSESWGD